MTRTLVFGGARSGKSAHAEKLARESGKEIIYIATAQAGDGEMATRITHHRAQRPAEWVTLEEPLRLGDAILRQARPGRLLLVDCLTLWLSNLMLGDLDVAAAVAETAQALAASPAGIVVVTNEVGQGIVPDNALARRFRDEAGWMNQAMAAAADRVVLVSAGLPLVLKG